MRLTVLFILLTTFLQASPIWFYTLKVSQKNEIIGYGVDQSYAKAKQQASASIVETISVEIDSSLNTSTSSTNGKVSKATSVNTSSSAHATLSGIKVIRSENIDNNWYVAVKYNNAPLAIKLKTLLPSNLKKSRQNSYLKNTALIKHINDVVNVDLNYEILRKDNLWQLQYQDILLPLTQDDIYQLFTNTKSNEISIVANKSVYKEKDIMEFKIEHAQPGYISILYVEHNGKVGVLLSNLKSKNHLTYPSPKSDDIFVVINPYNRPIKELYVALYSKRPIDLSSFENVTDTLLDQSNYNFDKLILNLDNISFSSYKIKIR